MLGRPWAIGSSLFALLLSLLVGCQQATRYPPRQPPKKTKPAAPDTRPEPLDSTLAWQDARFLPAALPIRIEFVSAETARAEWERLPDRLWHFPPLLRADGAASLAGFGPLASPGVLAPGVPVLVAALASQPVKIKVPLGLPDPQPNVPPGNPMTLSCWELGRELFFNRDYLSGKERISCAGCHYPNRGFTDGEQHGGFDTPTLLNCVWNKHQFWNGRAVYLEEAVQRSLEDERESSSEQPFRHAWGGAIHRLYNNRPLHEQFKKVFGTPPTQDALGKALAVYLRTLLCGDSLHDRALREHLRRGGAILEARDYEKVLPAGWGKEVDRADATPAALARELIRGYRLFHNQAPDRPTNCLKCHPGPLFTDLGFHNLGVAGLEDGQGRLEHAPIGLKERSLAGAFKTPTLRSLLRTAPYLHTGEQATLEGVVRFHSEGGKPNLFLDREMRAPDNPRQVLDLGLQEDDVRALVLFLKALNGVWNENHG